MSYQILELEQGTTPWLDYRKNHISATDVASILGIAYKKTAYQLWEEKLGLREPEPENDKMREGKHMEEIAREFLNKKYSWDLKPVVIQNKEYPFLMASLDGMCFHTIVEIKCGKSSHEMAKNKEIPPYYYSQLQHQMMVANVTAIDYVSFRSEEDWILLTVNRDDAFIEKMIEAEKQFYDCLMNFTPPKMTDKDYVKRDDRPWDIVAENLRYKLKQLEPYEKIKEEIEVLKQELIKMSNGQSSIGGGLKLTKIVRKGSVDYNAIDMLKSIDLEIYRKKSTEYYRISENE
jgi:putative phage-type endonuclease